MMTRLILISLLAAPPGLVLGYVGMRTAESDEVVRWRLQNPHPHVHPNVVNKRKGAIRYFLSEDGYSEENREAELNAVRGAFGQWQAIPNSHIRFEEAGLIGPEPEVDGQDDTNVVFWAKSSTLVNQGRSDLTGTAGAAFVSFFQDGTVADTDIAFNGAEREWFTDLDHTGNTETFVEAAALHEIGHMLGLLHSPLAGSAMLYQTPSGGRGADIRLSSDEVAFAQAVYPEKGQADRVGHLEGRVQSEDGAPVFGAAIIADDPNGRSVAGTVTRTNGTYQLRGLPSDDYQVRAVPLAPETIGVSLIQGRHIHPIRFADAETQFLPSTEQPVRVEGGQTETADFTVTQETPPFRVNGIRREADRQTAPAVLFDLPAIAHPGSEVVLGVFSEDVPSEDLTLRLDGSDLSYGSTRFRERVAAGFHMVSVPVTIPPDAPTGMRSFRLQTDDHTAYANGYLNILPEKPDNNFDGLDDRFQREHFPVFTASEAAPDADPDGDGVPNLQEYLDGTDPTNADSFFFEILQARLTAEGTTVQWQSIPGRRYQLFGLDRIGGAWEPVGDPVTADEEVTELSDPSATQRMRFYQVKALGE